MQSTRSLEPSITCLFLHCFLLYQKLFLAMSYRQLSIKIIAIAKNNNNNKSLKHDYLSLHKTVTVRKFQFYTDDL